MRKRTKKLVRVAIASGMLAIFVLPSAAQAVPVIDSDGTKGGGQVTDGSCEGIDPFARAMCNDTSLPSSEADSQPVSTGTSLAPFSQIDDFEPVANEPAPIISTSDDGGLALEWWLLAAGFVAVGAIGLTIGLREGPRPLA